MTPIQVAKHAETFLAGEMAFWDFMDAVNDSWDSFRVSDKPAWDLIFEIEHQPRLHDNNGKVTSGGEEWLRTVHELIAEIKSKHSE